MVRFLPRLNISDQTNYRLYYHLCMGEKDSSDSSKV